MGKLAYLLFVLIYLSSCGQNRQLTNEEQLHERQIEVIAALKAEGYDEKLLRIEEADHRLLEVPLEVAVEMLKELIDGTARLRREADLYREATIGMAAKHHNAFAKIPESEYQLRCQLVMEQSKELNIIIDSINNVLRSEGIEPHLYEKHEIFPCGGSK